jgi:hypothetical protein
MWTPVLSAHGSLQALLLVRLMSTFFLLPETKILSLGEMSPVAPEARRDSHRQRGGENGDEEAIVPHSHISDIEEQDRAARSSGLWLVAVNARGEMSKGGEAVLCILSHSPLLSFLPGVVRLGKALLGCCWRRRGAPIHRRRGDALLQRTLDGGELRVPWRKNKWRKAYSGWRQQVLAALFVLFILNWNASLTPGVPYVDSPLIRVIGSALRLDQFWGMFAPYPLTEDGWYALICVPRVSRFF